MTRKAMGERGQIRILLEEEEGMSELLSVKVQTYGKSLVS